MHVAELMSMLWVMIRCVSSDYVLSYSRSHWTIGALFCPPQEEEREVIKSERAKTNELPAKTTAGAAHAASKSPTGEPGGPTWSAEANAAAVAKLSAAAEASIAAAVAEAKALVAAEKARTAAAMAEAEALVAAANARAAAAEIRKTAAENELAALWERCRDILEEIEGGFTFLPRPNGT
jgi:hypothetical protein